MGTITAHHLLDGRSSSHQLSAPSPALLPPLISLPSLERSVSAKPYASSPTCFPLAISALLPLRYQTLAPQHIHTPTQFQLCNLKWLRNTVCNASLGADATIVVNGLVHLTRANVLANTAQLSTPDIANMSQKK